MSLGLDRPLSACCNTSTSSYSTADRFGRRFNLWAMIVLLVIVSLFSLVIDSAAVSITATAMQGNVLELVAKDWRLWAAAKSRSRRRDRCQFRRLTLSLLVFVGLGTGLSNTATVVYTAEVVPAQIRGAMIATWAFAMGIGQITSALGLQVLASTSHPNDYKRILYAQFIFSGLMLIFSLIMPETPCK